MRRPPAEPPRRRRSTLARRAAWPLLTASALLLTLPDCVGLTPIDKDICGNRVVEPDNGEVCDGEPGCGRPGTPDACRYVCEEIECPAGYGCGVDKVCRKHGGAFEILKASTTVTALDLAVGDINGDGCHETLLTTRNGSVVTAYASRSPGFCPSSEQVLPSRPTEPGQDPAPSPLLADLTTDGRLELVLSNPGLLGDGLFAFAPNEGPTFTALLYPGQRVAEPGIRPLKVRTPGGDVLVLLAEGEGPGGGGMEDGKLKVLAVSDPLSKPAPLGELPGSLAGLATFQAADLDGDGCDEVVAANRGATRIQLFGICDAGALGFTPLQSPQIQLAGGAALRERNATIAIVDHDGDGTLDIVTSAKDAEIHIAYGDGQGRFHSLPPPIVGAPDQQTSVLPLSGAQAMLKPMLTSANSIFVAADFDEDSPGAELSPVFCPPAGLFESPLCAPIEGECEAVVADIDADGRPDVVSTEGQQIGLRVQRGDGKGGFHESSLGTTCPARHLRAGDLDGDGVGDIAFFDQISPRAGELTTALRVAHGRAFAAPEAPAGAGLFPFSTGLTSGRFVQGARDQLYASRSTIGEMAASGLALIESNTERLLLAPVYFPAGPSVQNSLLRVELLATAAGRFALAPGGEPRPTLAVVGPELDPVTDQPGATRLWLVEGDPVASSLRAVFKGATPPPACDRCVIAPVDIDADGRDELILLGDHEITVYAPAEGGFEERLRFPSGHAFRSVTASNPKKHVPRPVIADLDGDGRSDVVARASTGQMIVLWGREDGGFDEAALDLRCAPEASCDAQAIARLDAPPAYSLPAKGIAVLGEGHLGLYRIDGSTRAFSPIALPPPIELPASTDFAALGVGDFDGDGVGDLVVMTDSTFVHVLRGIPGKE